MLYQNFTTVNAKSTIVENPSGTIKHTPIYPIFNSYNARSFSLGDSLPTIVNLDDKEYVTYPLRPEAEINLILISGLHEKDFIATLGNKITVKGVTFYIGNDPFGTTVPYEPEFEFKEVENGLSMKLYIDEPVESHGPYHVIKGRMKGEVRLDIGFINVWMEDVKVTDENGKDVTDQFHFTGYTVEGGIISTKPNNQ